MAVLLFWITGRLRHRVESALHARIHTVGIQSFAIVRAERARAAVSGLLRFLRILALLVLTFMWLIYALRQFPWTIGAANVLLDHVIAPLSTLGHGLLHAIPNLIFLVVLYFIVRLGLRVVRLFFEAVDRGSSRWKTSTRMGDADLQARADRDRHFRAGRRLSRTFRARTPSVQGGLAVPRRRVLARLVDGDLQHRRRLHDDVPAGVPRRRPREDRRQRRRRHRDAAAGHAPADVEERGDRDPQLADPQRATSSTTARCAQEKA